MSERVMKRGEESMVEHSYLLMPRNLNASGHLFGGQLLEWIDETAGIVAQRHAQMEVVTVAVDNMYFKAGAQVNDIVVLIGRLTHVGRSSMEVRVDSFVEALSGERHLVNVAYLVMVAIDEKGNPAVVPALAPETAEEQALFEAGRERARLRKARTAGA